MQGLAHAPSHPPSLSLLGFCAAAEPARLYVSPQGSDDAKGAGWSMKVPYRTLERATLAVRRLRGGKRGADGVTVTLLPGVYRLTEPLVLDAGVSGTEGAPTVFRTPVKGDATISGSAPVAGWRPWRDGIWQAQVETATVRTVYWDGERLPAARVPNLDPERPRTGGLLYAVDRDPEIPRGALRFAAGDLDVSRWRRPETARLVVWPDKNWNCDILPVRGVDAQERRLLCGNARYDIVRGNRYYVEHVLEELDAPGEWYFDAAARTLFLKPPVAGDPGDRVALPMASSLVRLAGTRERPVRHVVLEGLRFEGAAGHAVELAAAWECTVRACEITRTGTDGILLHEGSSENRIVGCDIAWTGTNGIRLAGVRDTTRQRTDGMRGNLVENNHLHHVGMSGNAGGAIDIQPYVGGNITQDNIIRRNEIHDAPRKGIMFGGIRNVVEGNHVHHVNLEQSDTGAIGLCTRDLTELGSVIRHNYLHDVGGYNMLKPGTWAFPSYCWGIYLDDWSSGVTVFGNVVAGAPSGAVHVHSGIDNTIENNLFLDSPGGHIQFTPIAPKTQNGKVYSMAGNRVRRNVVASAPESAWLAGRGRWQVGIAECDDNLLWFAGSAPTIREGRSKSIAWEDWRAGNRDTRSVVAAANPVRRTDGRYEVDPELAARIGFEPIPWDRIGLYESDDRFSWPVRTDWPREVPFPGRAVAAEPVRPSVATVPLLPADRRPPAVDGTLDETEWRDAGSLRLARDHGDRPATPPSLARVWYDARALYVAMDNPISAGKALRPSGDWGKVDALELALRPAGLPETAPILVLRGFPDGQFAADTAGGMAADAASRAGGTCAYGARIEGASRWTAEIAIPWAAIPGANGAPVPLQFNATCRKAADRLWIMWRPTGRHSYGVGEEGKLLPATPEERQ